MEQIITTPTNKEEFLQKWEHELKEATAMWELANRKGWSDAALIEGKRMSTIQEMLTDYKDTQ